MAGEQEAGPDPALLELDDIIDEHFDRMEEGAEDPRPDATDDDDITTDEDDETTSDEDLADDEAEDIDAEDAGEEDLEDADEDEEDEEEDEEDADEDEKDEEEEDEDEEEVENVLESVTAKELKRIEEDPVLKRLYRSMQRDYTKKTTELSERSVEVEAREKEISDFEGALRTAQGMANYLAATLDKRPDVVGAAFEAVATGDNGRDFLIAVGVEHPEVFERAYEMLHEILDDEDEKHRYIRERDLKVRDAELQEREDRIRKNTFDREYTGLVKLAEKEARRQGLDDDYLSDVRSRLAEKVRGQVRKDGTIVLGPADAKAVARTVKKEVEKIEARVLSKAKRRQVKESREATKKRAQKAKSKGSRSAPRGTPRKPAKDKKTFKPTPGVDPLDSFIEHRLSEQ